MCFDRQSKSRMPGNVTTESQTLRKKLKLDITEVDFKHK